MTTARWPDGHRAAVLITVNVDAERSLLTLDPTLEGRTKTLSTARYGIRRGLPAILAELRHAAVPASFFAPGSVVREHPGAFDEIARDGHDLGIRGDDLERLDGIEPDERRRLIARAVEAFRDRGLEPTGFRLPRGDWPLGLAADLLDAGIDWSSSWVAGDLPAMLPAGDGRSLVDLPFHHVADDRQAFEWNFAPALPKGHSRIASYEETLESWTWEFEGCRDEGLLWVLTVHPHIIGTPGRIGLLREMLRRIRRHDDVWVARGSTLASWWRVHGEAPDAGSAERVFLAEAGWPHY
ncbi:polysaccharide deacetylase family protein [Agromyces silvae]|uniref:polysaccharide deacetylase family protein n=1 Tax=Agromyces silvae TaxID=3388266 RepID=UPI00280A75DF|nr:polysaccharide deacetylase family protein [Agromyces protaetiae]